MRIKKTASRRDSRDGRKSSRLESDKRDKSFKKNKTQKKEPVEVVVDPEEEALFLETLNAHNERSRWKLASGDVDFDQNDVQGLDGLVGMVETLENYDLNDKETRMDILGLLPTPEPAKAKKSDSKKVEKVKKGEKADSKKSENSGSKKEAPVKKRKREDSLSKKRPFGIIEEISLDDERTNKRQKLDEPETTLPSKKRTEKEANLEAIPEKKKKATPVKEKAATPKEEASKEIKKDKKQKEAVADKMEDIEAPIKEAEDKNEKKKKKKKEKKAKKEKNDNAEETKPEAIVTPVNKKNRQASKLLGTHASISEQLKAGIAYQEQQDSMQDDEDGKTTEEGAPNGEGTSTTKGKVVITEDEARENWRSLGIAEPVIERLIKMNFMCPTEVQTQAVPSALLKRKNLIIASQTGSGKTLAFALPIITRLLTEKEPIRKVLRALVIVPSRELCIQANNMIKEVCLDTGIYTEIAVGGFFVDKNLKRVGKRCPEILVCTPARLWALMHTHKMSHLLNLEHLDFLVFDEADIMVKNGHYQELDHILKHIKHLDDNNRLQKYLTSATMTLPSRWSHERANIVDPRDDWEKDAENDKLSLNKLMEAMQFSESTCDLIDLTPESAVADTLIDTQITCPQTQKKDYLYYFLHFYKGRTIIFCNSVYSVQEIYQLMKYLKVKIYQLHGGMDESQRLSSLEKFLKHDDAALVATDAVARGIDIPHVTQIIHYELPTSADTYIHRCGRSGRAFNTGFSVAFVTEKDKRSYKIICGATKRKEGLPLFPVKDYYLRDIQGRTNIAWQMVLKEKDRLKKSHEVNWYETIAEEMDILLDEEEFSDIFEKKRELKRDRSFAALQKQLDAELTGTVGASRFAGQRDFITAETTDFSFLTPRSRDAREDFFALYRTIEKIDEANEKISESSKKPKRRWKGKKGNAKSE